MIEVFQSINAIINFFSTIKIINATESIMCVIGTMVSVITSIIISAVFLLVGIHSTSIIANVDVDVIGAIMIGRCFELNAKVEKKNTFHSIVNGLNQYLFITLFIITIIIITTVIKTNAIMYLTETFFVIKFIMMSKISLSNISYCVQQTPIGIHVLVMNLYSFPISTVTNEAFTIGFILEQTANAIVTDDIILRYA